MSNALDNMTRDERSKAFTSPSSAQLNINHTQESSIYIMLNKDFKILYYCIELAYPIPSRFKFFHTIHIF